MALQTSGPISLADIQAEFGGTNPISISEYYKNGVYVPSSIDSSLGPYWVNDQYEFKQVASSTTIIWNSVTILSATDIGLAGSYSSGGYTYYRGSLQETITPYIGPTAYSYQVTRTSSITVNASIPTSGTISFSNFYGGRKT